VTPTQQASTPKRNKLGTPGETPRWARGFLHAIVNPVRAVVQRVSEAEVTVDGEVVGAIGGGLCVLVGVTHDDTPGHAAKLAAKLFHLRVFDDEAGVMNLSLADTGGAALIVSQFTLYGDTSRGRRPSWVSAARPEHAEPLVDAVVGELRALGAEVASGRFRADMRVALVNDGPVTILVEV
jgi:D-tyrosyl-tRNA(Tyr) deacylase